MSGPEAGKGEEASPGCPSGASYAAARWVELTDDNAPWWARSTGVGLSLQLNEVQQLSAALQEGKVVTGAVTRLVAQARAAFVTEKGYAAEAFPEIRDSLQPVLRTKDANLLPGGAAMAAVEAAQQHLADIYLVDRLVTDVVVVAQKAQELDDFLEIDERITLLDAELAFMGLSSAWRSNVAHAVQRAVAEDEDFAEALGSRLARAALPGDSSFEVFVPLLRFEVDSGVVLRGSMIEREEAEDRVAELRDGDALLDELSGAVVVLRLSDIEARDVDAAAEEARDALGRLQSLWDLQNVEFELGANLLLRDESGGGSKRPTRREWVRRPANLKAYETARKYNADDVAIRRITDALDQLAQARSGSRGASLADLWTVSETLFGGHAEDSSAGVSEQLAGIAQYLYVWDLLRWLGGKLDPDKIDCEELTPEGDSEGQWALRCAVKRATSLPQKLVDADRPLEWVRFKKVLRWDELPENSKDNCHLGKELETIAGRVSAVGNRAYLVRNLFLHQGNPERAAAMEATLPIFASVLRAVIGHINRRSGELRLPLMESQLARMNVQHVAAAYRARPKSGPRPLDEFVDLTDE